jgi:hypothetical protein
LTHVKSVRRSGPCRASRAEREHPMLDVIMLLIAAAFFALSIGYAYACDRL